MSEANVAEPTETRSSAVFSETTPAGDCAGRAFVPRVDCAGSPGERSYDDAAGGQDDDAPPSAPATVAPRDRVLRVDPAPTEAEAWGPCKVLHWASAKVPRQQVGSPANLLR